MELDNSNSLIFKKQRMNEEEKNSEIATEIIYKQMRIVHCIFLLWSPAGISTPGYGQCSAVALGLEKVSKKCDTDLHVYSNSEIKEPWVGEMRRGDGVKCSFFDRINFIRKLWSRDKEWKIVIDNQVNNEETRIETSHPNIHRIIFSSRQHFCLPRHAFRLTSVCLAFSVISFRTLLNVSNDLRNQSSVIVSSKIPTAFCTFFIFAFNKQLLVLGLMSCFLIFEYLLLFAFSCVSGSCLICFIVSCFFLLFSQDWTQEIWHWSREGDCTKVPWNQALRSI